MGINKTKEFDYFECFCSVGKLAHETAAYLEKTVKNFDASKVTQYAEDMHHLENEADMKKHELSSHLAHEFLPPIEREDISQLAQELDSVVDSVEDVMRKIYMYNVRTMRSEAIEFAELVSESCAVFDRLLAEFHNFKKSKTLHDDIIEINTLENKGDKLHARSVLRLFSETTDAKELMVWNIIFEAFENSLDTCENAADIIESIIMKNT